MKKRNTTLWVLAMLGCLVSFEAFSQATVLHPTAGNAGTFTIGAGGNTFYNYYDNGGPGGAYASNIFDSQVTFAPSNATTNRVRVAFSSFNTEGSFDFLYIYNNNVSALGSPNLIGGYDGANNPGTIIANQGIGAVGANPSESLSFRFFSDFIVAGTGWAAVVDQVAKITCNLTVGGNVVVNASANACPGALLINSPAFAPAGCAATLQLQYSVNGGAFQNVAQPIPAQISVSGLSLGVNVLSWRLLDPASGNLISQGNQTVTVVDNIPPTITCPQNIIANLSPGECCRFVSWPDATATDNCPLLAAGPTQQLQQNVAFTNYWTGYAVNLENLNTGQAMNVTNVNVQASLAGNGAGTYNLRAYMKLGTHVGFTANAAAWTLVGSVNVTINAGFPTVLLYDIPFNTPFQIPAGGIGGLYVVANNGSGTGVRVVATIGNAPTQDANLRINQTPGNWVNNLFGGVAFAGENPRPQLRVSYNLQVDKKPVQIAGPISGTELCKENSPYTVVYRVEDAQGLPATCSFTITINPFQNAIQSLICNDQVQISLDPDCSATIGADQVLEGGPYRCYDDYLVELDKTLPFGNGQWELPVLGPGDVGKTYQVRVTDPLTGNKCWGNITVEDKFAPVLDCPSAIIPCNIAPDPLPIDACPVVIGGNKIIEQNVALPTTGRVT